MIFKYQQGSAARGQGPEGSSTKSGANATTGGGAPAAGRPTTDKAGVWIRLTAGLLISALLLSASISQIADLRAEGAARQSGSGNSPPGEKILPSDSATKAILPVTATVETEPVPNREDADDDPAIWHNEADPSMSAIIGTDKKGGLAVYDLAGKLIQYLPDGMMNNVDIRPFLLGGKPESIVAASNRSDNTIAIYRINPETRHLENVAARRVRTVTAYGCCLYRSARTGRLYYFVTSKGGWVQQWQLFDNRKGKIDARRVRSFRLRTQPEGCVCDDGLGHLYVGEENIGIWKYRAEPDGGIRRTMVDRTGAHGNLVADVEGLAIAYGKNGTGYLIASSQGNNTYVIYRREGKNDYVKTFRIVEGGGIDGVEETDGIEVSAANFGPAFPRGLFIAQDGLNDDGNQNFKLVPWHLIIDDDQ